MRYCIAIWFIIAATHSQDIIQQILQRESEYDAKVIKLAKDAINAKTMKEIRQFLVRYKDLEKEREQLLELWRNNAPNDFIVEYAEKTHAAFYESGLTYLNILTNTIEQKIIAEKIKLESLRQRRIIKDLREENKKQKSEIDSLKKMKEWLELHQQVSQKKLVSLQLILQNHANHKQVNTASGTKTIGQLKQDLESKKNSVINRTNENNQKIATYLKQIEMLKNTKQNQANTIQAKNEIIHQLNEKLDKLRLDYTELSDLAKVYREIINNNNLGKN